MVREEYNAEKLGLLNSSRSRARNISRNSTLTSACWTNWLRGVPGRKKVAEMAASIMLSLFLLDYHIPEIDGLERVERLHALRGLKSVQLLIMSANLSSRKALRQRGIAFLAKPFDLADLIEAIDTLLRGTW